MSCILREAKEKRLEKQAVGIEMTLSSMYRLKACVGAVLEPCRKADKKSRRILNTMLSHFHDVGNRNYGII